MSVLQESLHSHNPFSVKEFWGRYKDLWAISRYLLSEAPRCCAIIGEDTFGKTTLLQYLSNAEDKLAGKYPELDTFLLPLHQKFVFVYLDCASYGDEVADMENLASARFWWDLYSAASKKLQGVTSLHLSKPKVHADQEYIDTALTIRWELEDLIQNQSRKVAFVLDNFEGVAHLPLRDSEWLRSMAGVCTYVVASRDLLYLLYHSSSRLAPSPLWNLFGDPIYLHLPSSEDVEHFLSRACEKAMAENSIWKQSDVEYIKKMAGRHPELLRIVCSSMYEYRSQESSLHTIKQSTDVESFLDYRIDNAVGPICMQLWLGLARTELQGEPKGIETDEVQSISLHQQALVDIAMGASGTREASILVDEDSYEKQKILFDLERRDLVEYESNWHVFSEVMRRFVLKQVPLSTSIVMRSQYQVSRQREMPGLTYQEKKVYDYLHMHRGKLCLREDIMWAVWPNKEPTNSALQKIIERIREKIEPDPENPRYLIAVRGKGYILRVD